MAWIILHAEERAANVGANAAIELGGIDFGEVRRQRAVRGVVEGGVEAPEGADRLSDEVLDRRRVADVGRHGQHPAAGRTDALRHGFQGAFVARRQHDRRPRLRERARRRRADPPAGARHERDLPIKWCGHRVLRGACRRRHLPAAFHRHSFPGTHVIAADPRPYTRPITVPTIANWSRKNAPSVATNGPTGPMSNFPASASTPYLPMKRPISTPNLSPSSAGVPAPRNRG